MVRRPQQKLPPASSCSPLRSPCRRSLACALVSAALVVGTIGGAQPTQASSVLPDTLYGVAEGATEGVGVVTINQDDASTARLPGDAGFFQDLAFDSSGRLFATTCLPSCGSSGPSLLVELDPVTGSLKNTIGPVRDASGFQPILVALTAQPGTDQLYGIGVDSSSNPSGIWTIDEPTAIATRLPSAARGFGLAFGPDGTLYHSDIAAIRLLTLDPSTGAPVGIAASVAVAGGLAVRSDGIVFANTAARILPEPPCRGCPRPPPIFVPILTTIDLSTGIQTTVGTFSGSVHLGALDFSPAAIPEPSTVFLLAAGIAGLALRRRVARLGHHEMRIPGR